MSWSIFQALHQCPCLVLLLATVVVMDVFTWGPKQLIHIYIYILIYMVASYKLPILYAIHPN